MAPTSVGRGTAEKSANPFAPGQFAERRRALVASLREDRGQGTPAPKVEPLSAPAPDEAAPKGDTAAGVGAASASTPAGTPDALAVLQAQYQQREAAIQAAEAKVREATTLAEKRAAEAEAKEAKNAAHLQRLEMLRGDPIQFLADAGITEEEFKGYLAAGGKQTPEQKRIALAERQLADMRAQMEALRDESAKSVAAIRREREEAEFAAELSRADYTLVNTMGGIPAVRAKQAALRETLGKEVTLAEAAGQLEHEWDQGFKTLLKNEAVRAKLGLSAAASESSAPAAGSKAPGPRTLNGSMSSSTAPTSSELAWDDWRGKKEQVLRQLARAGGN